MSEYRNSREVSKIATNKLARAALANNITRQQMGNALGVARQTLSRRINDNALALTDFFEIADEIGIDPVELLAEAQNEAARRLEV